MTVGQTLTEARSQAGLTVDELSERTRIRGTVIRSIEQDDYEACGGDLYVRGYVRALAGAVGIDAQPLIREYELGRAGQESERASGSVGRHAKGYPAAAAPDTPTALDLPAVTVDPASAAGPGATRLDLPLVTGDPAVTAFDLPAVSSVPPAVVPPAAAQPPGSADTRYDLPPVTEDLMSAGYDMPAGYDVSPGYDLTPQAWPGQPGDSTAVMPALGYEPAASPAVPGQSGGARFSTGHPVTTHPGTTRKNRRVVITAVVAVVAVVALGALGFRLATGGTARSTASAGASAASVSAAASASASAAAQASAAASASAAAQASASASAASASASRASAKAVTRLPVVAALAFGPDGLADGDDPSAATGAISGGASRPWSTQWYATPEFGMLKHGTGLLLDLGGKATVSSVVIELSRYSGASLQIRAGNGTAPQDLRVAAAASNAGGMLRLTLPRPVTARYLLVWFTRLPPDGSGHYAETVSQVKVTGHR